MVTSSVGLFFPDADMENLEKGTYDVFVLITMTTSVMELPLP